MPLYKGFSQADLLKKGFRVARTPFFLLKIGRNDLSAHRIAVVVAKSSIKSAVKRNFWKRQARALITKLKKEPSDVILILNKNIALITKKRFQEELRKALL